MASQVVIRILSRDYSRKGFEKAGRNVKRLSAGLDQANRRMKMIGVLAAGAAVIAIKKFSDFDKGIREVTTLLGDVSEQGIRTMGNEIKSMSIEFGQAIDRMTKAKYDIVSAGFVDAAESATVLAQSAKLAVAGVSTVSKTADVLTTVLNAYSKKANDARRISDVLFTTVRLGKTTIDQLAGSFGNAAAIAPQLGVSVEAVAAGIATLTARGINTMNAVTALQATFVAFLRPSDELSKRLKSLEYDSGKAAVEALGFQGALKAVTDGATEAEKASIFPNIRAMKAVFPLVGTAAGAFSKNLNTLKIDADATEVAFKKMADSLSFRLSKAKQKINVAMIGIGEGLTPIAESFASVVGGISDMGAAGGRMLAVLIPGTAAIWAFSGAIIALTGPIGIITTLVGVGLVAAFVSIKTPAEKAAESVDKYATAVNKMNKAERVKEQSVLKKKIDSETESLKKLKSQSNSTFSFISASYSARAGQAGPNQVLIEKEITLIDTLKKEYDVLTSAIKASDKAASDKAASDKAALDKASAEVAKAAAQKAAQEKKTELSNSENELQALRNEFNLTAEQQELTSLAKRLAMVDANWKNKAELSGFYNQKEKEFDEQKFQQSQQEINAELALIDQKHQAKLDLLAEFNTTWEQQELASFDQRLANVDQYWENDDALMKLHDSKRKEILAKSVEQEAQAMMQRSNVWKFGVSAYDSFSQNILRTDITGKQKREKIWESLKSSFISILSDMLKRKIATALVEKGVMAASQIAAVTTGAATGTALASAYAPAATFASVMSFGGAAVAGEAGIVAALATTRGLSVLAAENGMIVPNHNSGIQSGTDKVLTILTPGELVVDRGTTEKIKQSVNNSVQNNSSDARNSYTIAPVFNINAIDSSGFETLIRSESFKESFIDLINERRINLEINADNSIEAKLQ